MKIISKIILLYLLVFVATAFAQEAQKVDEIKTYYCDELKFHIYDFAVGIDNNSNSINNNPNAKGYIISYEGKYSSYLNRLVLPRFGEVESRLALIKKHLLFLRYPMEKIVFIKGGFREEQTVEFWIVPNGAEPPKTKPTLDKIKYRKGKPPKLLMGDC